MSWCSSNYRWIDTFMMVSLCYRSKRYEQPYFIPGITISPSPNMENGRAAFAVGNKSCNIWNTVTWDTNKNRHSKITMPDSSVYRLQKLTLIGASKDFATLTITGVKKTQNMSYMKSPPCKQMHQIMNTLLHKYYHRVNVHVQAFI